MCESKNRHGSDGQCWDNVRSVATVLFFKTDRLTMVQRISSVIIFIGEDKTRTQLNNPLTAVQAHNQPFVFSLSLKLSKMSTKNTHAINI
jgi:hypothetical protein